MRKDKNPFEDQIGNVGGAETDEGVLNEAAAAEDAVDHGVTGLLGTRIASPEERRKGVIGESKIDRDAVTGIGANILERAEIKKGWIPVDKALLGERGVFYPETWEFMVRPATVEAIKAWSTIDEDNPRSVDSVLNEVLKACLSIRDTATDAAVNWAQINSWDRFFFVLLIRDCTFSKGESKIEYEDECGSCDAPIMFKLDTTSLYYDMPDPDVMKYWDREERAWLIDTEEFGLDKGVLKLYVPTVEKDQNLFQYVANRYQEKGKVSRELEIFLKYLVWLLPKAPKDQTILKRKVREAELEFKGWDIDEFVFIDEVVRNITISPSTKLKTVCPECGEEATSDIRFPDGIRSLFAVKNRFKKFGSK